MKQAEDFRQEVSVLAELLAPLDDAALAQKTQFQGWRIDEVLGHLYLFDTAALISSARASLGT